MAIPAAAAAAYRPPPSIGAAAAASGRRARRAAGRQFLGFPVRRGQGFHQHHPPGRTGRHRPGAGKANMVDVVQSVNAAELTLDTVVAVRDKVVAAYQSIMNMPI